ncbi:hypothetical protein RRG08_014792 [Elysia crispata]|uniref:Uncharacterized protein n=1 Tax=Elysia crispata TaxID=231223 RepID=A0AAE1AXL7_9GAST|nr:hypothetical protein RRG08_014792 [Elysia crispata]
MAQNEREKEEVVWEENWSVRKKLADETSYSRGGVAGAWKQLWVCLVWSVYVTRYDTATQDWWDILVARNKPLSPLIETGRYRWLNHTNLFFLYKANDNQ